MQIGQFLLRRPQNLKKHTKMESKNGYDNYTFLHYCVVIQFSFLDIFIIMTVRRKRTKSILNFIYVIRSVASRVVTTLDMF